MFQVPGKTYSTALSKKLRARSPDGLWVAWLKKASTLATELDLATVQGADSIACREHLQPRAPGQWAADPDRADGLGPVRDLRDHARGRFALRDARDERPPALLPAHVLQGDGGAAGRPGPLEGDRRDRRRVKRFPRQGVHGLLRQGRGRVAGHRPRRSRRNAPPLQV